VLLVVRQDLPEASQIVADSLYQPLLPVGGQPKRGGGGTGQAFVYTGVANLHLPKGKVFLIKRFRPDYVSKKLREEPQAREAKAGRKSKEPAGTYGN
jgi:hypothetical protein